MLTIHKYVLETVDFQMVGIHQYHRFIAAGCQDGKLVVWAEVNTSHMKHAVPILIVGTGNPMPQAVVRHIGTVQMPPFVWHVYEGKA